MSFFWCKYAALFSIFFPMFCAAETPELPAVPQNAKGSSAMDEAKLQFPVKTFDLNSEDQVNALVREYEARSAQTKNQAELGLHGVYSVRSADDIGPLLERFEFISFAMSVFEIRFMNDVKAVKFVPISAQNMHLKLIVSGASDSSTDVSGISFALYADNIRIHHLKWGNTGIKTALTVGAKDSLELDHLEFTDNQYDGYFDMMAEARVEISSNADPGQFTSVLASNLTFKNNKAGALMMIEKEALDKIGSLAFDHLTLENNQTRTAGIDVSAAQKVVLSHVSISGHKGSSAITQRTPNAEVVISSSKLPEGAYQYVPLPKYKDKAAKPVKIAP